MPSIRHILLVDDHTAVRTVLSTLQQRLDPDVAIVEAWDGAEALRAVAQQRPDLIITDYRMPVMGGRELVRKLRRQGETMPILILSSECSIAEAILMEGATAFLPKPFAFPTLRGILRSLLPHDEASQVIGE